MERRSKIARDVFRCFTSRIFPLKSPIQHPKNTLSGSSCSILATKSNTNTPKLFSSYSINIPGKKKPAIWQYFGLTKIKGTQYISPFNGCCGAKRYYRVDRHHFKPQGRWPWPWRWFRVPRNAMLAGLVGSGVVATLYFRNLETIPYSKRTHLVLLSKKLERKLGDYLFEDKKEEKFQGKILPATHPKSIQVRSISNNIIQALEDKGEGLNWEVVVVDKPKVSNAFCYLGGKIVVYTGILKHFKSDAEIATIIGHEVGHAVARHVAEDITSGVWLGILKFIILYPSVMSESIVDILSNIFLELPFSRRMEMEADYIGLMLMASAGYDPRVAPKVFDKIGGRKKSLMKDYLSTHPSRKKRAKLLAQPKVMEQALLLYNTRMREQESRDVGIE